MPLDVIRALDDDSLQRMIRSIPPRQLVAQLAKLDRRVYFRWFKGYRPDKISRNRVSQCVQKEVFDGDNETMSELLVVAWNAANWDLYEAMRKNVAKINPNVEEIERIEDEQAETILEAVKDEGFEDEDVWLCTLLNEVRFTPEFKAKLAPNEEAAKKAAALAEKKAAEKHDAEKSDAETSDAEKAEEGGGEAASETAGDETAGDEKTGETEKAAD